MDDTDGSKVIRAKSLKRGKTEERITDRIKLERVLGVTVSSNAALATDNNGIIAYPAGCTVVLFNTKTEQQNHIINTNRKTITSLAYSSCGRYIVTGECGHQPAVRVWDLQSELQSSHPGLAPQPQQVAEFIGHKYGVNCVAFSSTSKYVVSVGTQHDMIVCVWDWRNNVKVASNKVSTKVKSIAFAENGSYFVTVGNRHVKFWFLEQGKTKYKEAVPLMGRSAILGEQRNNYFCDVACGRGECGDSTYAITRSGLLCEFNNRRLLDKWVELRTTSANCITVGQNHIFVGCAEGIIRCFDPSTLRFITTLPRCHYLGVDVALGTNIQHMASPPPDAKYPDTRAITFDESNHKLTAVYNDHSIYIWDVSNIRRVGKSCSFLYHSACIWGVEMAPPNSPLPPGSFLTCSSDDTIRVWTLDKLNEKTTKGMYQQNIYSNELLKVVYVDKDLSYIKDLDMSGTISNEKQPEQTTYDGKNGVRCIKVSPDGKHLASGDRSGNIRIHDTATMREQFKIEAHDSEVLNLEYSAPDSNYSLLASASRDRLIHVFDTKQGYDFVQTLDDHSSSITAVRFLNHSNNIQMVSCGADKSLIFRSLGEVNGKVQFVRDHNATGKTTLYDMEVDTGQKHILTACQDRNVRIYSVNTGKHTKTFKGSTGDDGTLIKVVLDRSGIYLATSCTDKSLSVYDYYTGECMATMCGHSELATGLRFTNDCKRLISASGDGCVFVWRVPHDMMITMHARLSQQAMRQGKSLETEMFNDSTNFDFYDGKATAEGGYRFSIGQLPQWAKKQLAEDSSQPSALPKNVAPPKGRWAQRAENTFGVQAFYSANPLQIPVIDKRLDSDGSKDSSLDSGTEVKQYNETRREPAMLTKLPPTVTIRDKTMRGMMTDDSAIGDVESTAHDGDIDSDNEYGRNVLYYPSRVGSPNGAEFPVTNIDTEELRKSQRKKKLPQIVVQRQPLPASYGSNDSDDEDDDASTPSGENTDRNPMSLFSVSSESLDQLVNRERYLQSTFESMSGADPELIPTNKSSISSKFLTNSGNRNIEAINAVKQTRTDPEAIRKRQELNKRIAETKKKLESVGHSSQLKYSKSTQDLSHIPERDQWSKKPGNTSDYSCSCCVVSSDALTNTDYYPSTNITNHSSCSRSVPSDLQLCGCYMRDIAKNTTQLSHVLGSRLDTEASSFRESLVAATKSPEKSLNEMIRPRKLQLDKTLAKYKMHKSLPVSPVSEERQFADYVDQRQSFSYFADVKNTDEGFKQVCDDIEKFSEDFNKRYDKIGRTFDSQMERGNKYGGGEEEEGNFSSDSLEDYNFFAAGARKRKKTVPPRRCVSNNEIYRYQEEYLEEIPKSESFYLNQSINNSQDSILSDEQLDYYSVAARSSCNSLESVASNESDCKSAPLEALFEGHRQRQTSEAARNMSHSQSLPKNISTQFEAQLSGSLPKNYMEPYCSRPVVKTSQTQTDFETPQQLVAKKARGSEDFQRKLLKFENDIAHASAKKPVAFFVETSRRKCKENIPVKKKNNDGEMYIPSMATKNKQYKSKFCNVLNNKPDVNLEIFESPARGHSFALSTINFETNSNKHQPQETTSLDRHLFAKGLLHASEKITHKPPKAVRRHSSKTRKGKTTYEYIRKEDYYKSNKKRALNNRKRDLVVSDEHTIEISFKEKNVDFELQASSAKNEQNVSNNILTELYDSLDKKSPPSRMDLDSLEVNINNQSDGESTKLYDSLEVGVWSKGVTKNTALQLENVLKKQHASYTCNESDDEQTDKRHSPPDKIAVALENIKILNEIQRKIHKINNLVDIYKRNVSRGKVRALSSMYESMSASQSYYNDLTKLQATPLKYRRRNLSLPSFVERRLNNEPSKMLNQTEEVHVEDSSPDSSLRRSCSLSDLSMQAPLISKRKIEQVAGKKVSSRMTPRQVKSQSMMRSKSSVVLNHQSDSDDNQEKKVSRLMRPTISSYNKISNKSLQSRKKQSYSTSNLNTLGVEPLSTSDSELETKKPSAPPRPSRQQLNHENGQASNNSRRHMNNKDKVRAASRHDNALTNGDVGTSSESVDLSSIEFSNELCEEMSKQLVATAEAVVKIYNCLKGSEEAEEPHPEAMDCVKMSIIRTHKMIHDCILNELKQNNVDVNQTDAIKKLNDLVSKGCGSAGLVIELMQQYSDILLDMMQQKIHSANL